MNSGPCDKARNPSGFARRRQSTVGFDTALKRKSFPLPSIAMAADIKSMSKTRTVSRSERRITRDRAVKSTPSRR